MRNRNFLFLGFLFLFGCGGGTPSQGNRSADAELDVTEPEEDVLDEVEEDPFGIIFISPTYLNFSDVASGEIETATVTISNSGTERFRILEIDTIGDAAFSVNSGTQVFPSYWDPDESLDVTITFAPESAVPAEARLVVTHDATEGSGEILLTGNTALPCLEVTPQGPIFMGGHQAGSTSIREIVVHNCSLGEELSVTEISFESDNGFEFGLLPDGTNGNSFNVRAGYNANLTVRYNGEETAGTMVQLASNDPVLPLIRIPISSAGVSTCPTAIARCREVGEEEWSSSLSISTDVEVECDSSDSVTDGDIVESYWELLSVPAGGHRVVENEETTLPTFFFDTPGTYLLNLHVLDEADQTSCVASEVEFTVENSDQLTVLLEWTGGDVPTDADANLNLHLRRGDTTWEDEDNNFSATSNSVDWGGEAHLPKLLIGSRYERISIPEPETDMRYRVGVMTDQTATNGSTFATVRVYLGDELVQTHRMRDMSAENAFWEVLDIDDGDITIIDNITSR